MAAGWDGLRSQHFHSMTASCVLTKDLLVVTQLLGNKASDANHCQAAVVCTHRKRRTGSGGMKSTSRSLSKHCIGSARTRHEKDTSANLLDRIWHGKGFRLPEASRSVRAQKKTH